MKSDTANNHPPSWWQVDLPQVSYIPTLDLQHQIVAAVQNRNLASGVVLVLEHRPVFTMGRRGGQENLCVTQDVLDQAGVELVQVERGGDITYHGPGQLVIYPIVDLRQLRLGVVDFVTALEEVMIRTAAGFGVAAGRNDMNRGVWVGMRKLGSIGIAVRRGVSFHGLAFNANTDLTPFGWINPCGLHGVGVTSLQKELEKPVETAQVREAMVQNMADVFNLKLQKQSPDTLFKRLHTSVTMEDLKWMKHIILLCIPVKC